MTLNWIYRSIMDSSDLSIDYPLMEVVRKELIQLHCENVLWERASDKIPLELVRYLLGDLVPYLSTLVFLRGNRCLFLLEWPQTIDSNEAWIYASKFHWQENLYGCRTLQIYLHVVSCWTKV